MSGTAYRLVIGLVSQAAMCVPLWIAESEGYLAAEAIATEHRVLQVTDRVTAALRDGEVAFALTTPEGAIADAVAGGPLRVVAGVCDRPPLNLVAQPSVRAVADLRGGTVGTTSLAEGTRHLAEAMLAAHGLAQPADYRFVLTGNHTERWRMLRSGELTAALQPIPFPQMARDAGFSDLGPVDRHVPDFAFVAVCGHAGFLGREPEVSAGFLRALLRGAAAFHRDPERWTALAAGMMGVPQEYARSALRAMADRGLVSRDLRMSPAALHGTAAILRRSGALPPPAPGVPQPEVALDYAALDRAARTAVAE
ncbi:ABC transporter substrate-binding protein [Streptomyces sp. SL13]|uniref:ABC transporter substrate-binding protein n=2 Tax=Streptantibioticus silvisoli TaxID=2705255 RepID=A0AA90K002_9ACTN|nr:ABC transporter substrate-binding protein [Streptantibioticus silvisoli]MDI5972596.1 ABC transporter substrate-binding protein [Streptantibioticus silvisoli]